MNTSNARLVRGVKAVRGRRHERPRGGRCVPPAAAVTNCRFSPRNRSWPGGHHAFRTDARSSNSEIGWRSGRARGRSEAPVAVALFGLFWNGIVSVFVLIAIAGSLHAAGVGVPSWFPPVHQGGGMITAGRGDLCGYSDPVSLDRPAADRGFPGPGGGKVRGDHRVGPGHGGGGHRPGSVAPAF